MPAPTDKLLPLFEQPHLKFVMQAMIAGNSPALVWMDDTNHSALIWDNTHCLYLGGDSENPKFNEAIRQIWAGIILPEARARHLGIFKLYTTHEGWIKQATRIFDKPFQARERSLFVLDEGAVDKHPVVPPDGFRVVPINREFLAEASRANLNDLISEIEACWPSVEQFLANGFGVCVLSESDEVACWCTAEYVSYPRCGVGIETVEKFQRRGLATIAARVFAQNAVAKGWAVHWDSWSANLPSIKVAQKVGFQKLLDYSIELIRLGE